MNTKELTKLKPVTSNGRLSLSVQLRAKKGIVPYVPFRTKDPYIACPICRLGFTYLGLTRHVMKCGS